MKAALFTLSAASVLSALPLGAQTKSAFVETTTLTFAWSMSSTYFTETRTDGPTIPNYSIFDPESIPGGYDSYSYVTTPLPYSGSTPGNTYPTGANRHMIQLLLQRLIRNGVVARNTSANNWQFIAVREAPSNVKEMATNPYRIFLTQGGRAQVEVAAYGQEPIIDDPVTYGYLDSTLENRVVTIDTGLTLTLGQYNGSYTESKWSDTNWVRSASGNVVTAFSVDFGSLLYDDLKPRTGAKTDPYNYHLKRNEWRALASGTINYGIRTIPGPLPTFLAANVTGTATGWFTHDHTEYKWNSTDKVYDYDVDNSYYIGGIAPLKVTLAPIQYQKRTLFDLNIPEIPTIGTAENVGATTSFGFPISGVAITWLDNSFNETGFSLQRKDGDDGEWTDILHPDRNTFTITDLDAPIDTFCHYRIAAYNGGGISEFSDEVVIVTVATPTFLRGTPTSTEIALSWFDNSEIETGYELQRLVKAATATEDAVWETIATTDTLPADTTTYTDIELKAKTAYTYRVRALYIDTTTTPATTTASGWSNVVVVTTADTPAAPATPPAGG